jgi:ATP-binding cassette subfamily C protein CydCD
VKPVDPRLLRRARPVRAFLAALAVLGAVDALLLICQATLLADLVTRLVHTPQSAAPLRTPLLGLVGASAARAALAWLREACAVRTSAAVKRALRADLVAALVRGPARAADRARTGELATLATRGVDALDGYFSRYLPQLALAAIVPAVLGARILAADRISTLIIVATLPLIPIFMILIGLATRDHMQRRWAALERLGGHFLEVVAGLPTLIAYGRAERQTAVIRRAADAHRRATVRTLRVAFLSSLALDLIATLSVALIAVGIGLRLADGSLDLRTGLLVLICAPEVYLPLRLVGARYHEAAEGLAAADRVFAVTGPGAGTETAAGPAAPIPAHPASGAPLTVRFQGVRIARDTRDDQRVPDLELSLRPGHATALVGPSGAGKSTLLNLLLGFDTPSCGRITVDGGDLAGRTPEAWRERIAWLPQHPRLTGATVADAIRLGAPAAGDDEVARAARAAGIDFPLDTPLGRDGTALSGGQARRVALARAILRDAPLVLLDEPTEHLDPDTERVILAALRAWLPGRTALVITHRPALLELCDTVVRVGAPAAAPAPAPAADLVPAPVTAPPTRDAGPRRIRMRILAAVGLGAASSLCAVGLAAASAWLIAEASLRPPLLSLQVGIAAVQAFSLSRASLRYAERLAGHDATLRILAEMRVRVYKGLLRRAPAGMAAQRDGDLLANLTADVDAAQDLFLKVLLPAAGAAAACAGLVLFDLCLAPAAALTLAAGIVAAGVLAPALTRATARSAERRTASARAEMAEHTVQLLSALPDLVAYGAAGRHAREIAADDARLTALERRGALASGLGAAVVTLASGATVAALAAVALTSVRAGHVGGTLAAALVLAPLALFEQLAALPDAARALDRGRAGWDCLRRIAQAPALIPVPDAPHPLAWTGRSVLTFERVTAAWPTPAAAPPSAHLALVDLSFTLRSGGHTEISGPSGVGKSTLAALASRCLDPVSGAVSIDGTDLRDADPRDVRALIAVCAQDAHLFDASIRENLRIARPDATDAELWHALAAVRLDAWIRTLPHTLDTPVGQLGDAVSGGERQRIALARALLSPAPVVVLDEPLAHLDARTGAAVEANLRRELRGRTVLWIRHAEGSAQAQVKTLSGRTKALEPETSVLMAVTTPTRSTGGPVERLPDLAVRPELRSLADRPTE